MRFIYFDIDSLRADHLGCYGYHRPTSPHIDRIASEGVRFENLYVSDAPCLPSRTALWSGRFGIHNGVVNHGGTAAAPFPEPNRWVTDVFHDTGWMPSLRAAGYRTVTVSTFAERHAAWHWFAGYNEVINCGREGMERADEVSPLVLDWLSRNGKSDRWFLHVNLWDPHIPYRTPLDFGEPFADFPLPAWMTEEVWRRGWEGYGPHSPQEPHGYGGETFFLGYPRFPVTIDSMDAVKRWYNGYDTGILFADEHIGRVLAALEDLGVLDDTAIIVGGDHGESMGEFNVWGDHQTADQSTCRVPLIMRWPGVTRPGGVDHALRYHVDWPATLIDGVGGNVPPNWDGRSFLSALKDGRSDGRPFLVVSQGAHICQRGIRFDDGGEAYLCLYTWNPGYKMIRPVMLFNLSRDPHEQDDLADDRPDLVEKALSLLATWQREMMLSSTTGIDPMMIALKEGPLHARGMLKRYAERLRATGRADHVPTLLARQPNPDRD